MTYWRLFYHLVWSTRYREPVIDERIETIVRRAINGLAAEKGATIYAIGVMPDHIHVALSIPPKYSISEVVNILKGSSSHLLGHELATPEESWPGWQSEYGVISFSEKSLNRVMDYVNHQREHHGSNTLIAGLEREERIRPDSSKPNAKEATM